MSVNSEKKLASVQRIALIGYRGTGKSTVARELAERLKWEAVDADELLESRAGKTIKEIFAEQGEPAFREQEAAIVTELCQREKLVAALGGGAILRPENREVICRGVVIWLTADAATIASRIHTDPNTTERRPNLTAAGGMVEIEHLLRVREPLYRECADFVVDTVKKTPAQIADEIVCLLHSE